MKYDFALPVPVSLVSGKCWETKALESRCRLNEILIPKTKMKFWEWAHAQFKPVPAYISAENSSPGSFWYPYKAIITVVTRVYTSQMGTKGYAWHVIVMFSPTFGSVPKMVMGGFSLTNGIWGCSKVLRCIFVSFGISMGGLSSYTQCTQFSKLGVFWKI